MGDRVNLWMSYASYAKVMAALENHPDQFQCIVALKLVLPNARAKPC